MWSVVSNQCVFCAIPNLRWNRTKPIERYPNHLTHLGHRHPFDYGFHPLTNDCLHSQPANTYTHNPPPTYPYTVRSPNTAYRMEGLPMCAWSGPNGLIQGVSCASTATTSSWWSPFRCSCDCFNRLGNWRECGTGHGDRRTWRGPTHHGSNKGALRHLSLHHEQRSRTALLPTHQPPKPFSNNDTALSTDNDQQDTKPDDSHNTTYDSPPTT